MLWREFTKYFIMAQRHNEIVAQLWLGSFGMKKSKGMQESLTE